MAELSEVLAGGPRPPTPPVQATAEESSEDLKPNSTMGIISFIFGLSGFLAVPGLILGIIALHRSKAEERHFGLACWGICLSAFTIAVFVTILIVTGMQGDSTVLTDPAFTDPAAAPEAYGDTCDTYGWASVECDRAIMDYIEQP